MRVLLQPSSNAGFRDDYSDTIINKLRFDDYALALAPVRTDLNRIYPNQEAHVWGVVPGESGRNVSSWSQAEVGDVVLFARDNRIFRAGTITLKFHSAEFSRALWGQDKDDRTWEFTYFLDQVRSLELPYAELNTVLGYAPATHRLTG